jgi:hypothetical protein
MLNLTEHPIQMQAALSTLIQIKFEVRHFVHLRDVRFAPEADIPRRLPLHRVHRGEARQKPFMLLALSLADGL